MRAAIGLTLLLSGTAQAGAWTQPRGAYYAKIWDRTLLSPYGILADGAIEEVPFFQDHALNAYAELGLSDQLTLTGFTNPLGFAAQDTSALYVGTSWVGLRQSLLRGTWRLAVEGRLGGALEARTVGSGTAASGEDWVYRPSEGAARGELELQLGRGLGQGWFVASAGLVAFTGQDLDPTITGMAQVGRPFGALQPSVTLTVWQTLGEITETNIAGAGQTAYVGLMPELAWWLREGWALGLGVGGALQARANAAAPSLSVSLHHRGQRAIPDGG